MVTRFFQAKPPLTKKRRKPLIAEEQNLHQEGINITVNTDNTVSSMGKMVRTSVAIPESLKREMSKVDINWSAVIREAIRRRLNYEHEKNVIEAVLINEKLRRKAPEGWDSAKVIRIWRNRRS